MRPIIYLSTFFLSCCAFLLSAQPTFFKVTIENVGQAFPYTQSGVFNTPVGEAGPGPLLPGGIYEFSFDAAPGSYLSFATMFVQSNDLFYAPSESGIALYDMMGNPVSGDLTDQLLLWDAGTEANQAPGEGTDQAPVQSGPNTGAADPDNTVRLVNDGYTYPLNNEVIRFTLTHNGGTSFTAQIENVSTGNTLTLSDGSTVAVPMAPGVFVVHSAPAPLFAEGQPDYGEGLEGIAEDGDASLAMEVATTRTGITTVLSPGTFAVHGMGEPFFTVGEMDRGLGLAAIAEDGNPGILAGNLRDAAMMTVGSFAVPLGAAGPAPAFPGDSYEFVIASGPTGYLSFNTMFVQSNDLFYGPDATGIALFDTNGSPIEGDITEYVDLWDVGSELNEIPGIGLNQAPRQSGADTGASDPDNTVRLVNDGFTYPMDESAIRVTITPLPRTQFTVRIENVGDDMIQPTGNGMGVPVPLAPGVWAVHSVPGPLFTTGEPDRGLGLEAIAEDGDPSMLNDFLSGRMGTPRGVFNTPVGAAGPAPLFPGEAYEFDITAAPGMHLSLATMYVQSNDLFYSPDEMGLPLFDENGNPLSGDITAYIDLWDAGTEENEQPGIGPNQAPRQSGPNTGPVDTDDLVRLVNDGYTYAADEDVIRVTLSPVVETARVQIIHAAISQTVSVYLNGEMIIPVFAYQTATPYVDIPAGTNTITIVPVGGPTPAEQTETFELTLEANETYVAAVYGTFDASDDIPVQIAALAPATETSASGTLGLSFFSGAIDVATVDIDQNGAALFEDVANGTFADFVTFPASNYEINLTSGISDLGTYQSSFDFWSGRSAVIFTTGSYEGGNFQPWVALDNGGTYPLFPSTNLGQSPSALASTVAVEDLNLFPNPTNAEATLQYRLEETANVSIRLVDMTGKQVQNIFEGLADRGIHTITRDFSALPAGVYFYSVVMGAEAHTFRLVLQ